MCDSSAGCVGAAREPGGPCRPNARPSGDARRRMYVAAFVTSWRVAGVSPGDWRGAERVSERGAEGMRLRWPYVTLPPGYTFLRKRSGPVTPVSSGCPSTSVSILALGFEALRHLAPSCLASLLSDIPARTLPSSGAADLLTGPRSRLPRRPPTSGLEQPPQIRRTVPLSPF